MEAAGLAEVLATFGPAYLATQSLPRGGAKVWRAILACRTAALGGHIDTCDCCGRSRHVYHSCRNRHCPRCQTRAKEAWVAARRREVLPVPYFHLVFTLPHDLNRLIAATPRPLYETLFGAVSATLTEFAANRSHLGGVAAFSLVLHTWKQDLGRHVHVHALVAGGALAETGEWIAPKKGFLFPVRALSKVFRGKFVAGLDGLRAADRLPASLATDSDWHRLRQRLYAHDWVVYAKQPLGGPESVLEYLGRPTAWQSRTSGLSVSTEPTWLSACVPMPPAARNGRCAFPDPSSSAAFYSTSCRPASSGFGTTACSRPQGRRAGWPLPGSPSACHLRSRR